MPAIVTLLLPLLPDLIRGVESLIQGEKKGADRMDVVRQMARAIVTKLIATGQAPTEAPSDDALTAMIETEFQRMRTAPAPPPAPPAGDVWLIRATAMQKVGAL